MKTEDLNNAFVLIDSEGREVQPSPGTLDIKFAELPPDQRKALDDYIERLLEDLDQKVISDLTKDEKPKL